jgi:hypothetical protein
MPQPLTLYERLGGVYSIATVVEDLIDRIMVDPRLNANPRVDEAHHRTGLSDRHPDRISLDRCGAIYSTCAAYAQGLRVATVEIANISEELKHEDRFVWVGLYEPGI